MTDPLLQMGAGAGGVAQAGASLVNTASVESRNWASYIRQEVIKSNQTSQEVTWTGECEGCLPDFEKLIEAEATARGVPTDGWTGQLLLNRRESHLFSVVTARTSNKLSLLLGWDLVTAQIIDPLAAQAPIPAGGSFVTNVSLDIYGSHMSKKGWKFKVEAKLESAQMIDAVAAVRVAVSVYVTNANGTRSDPFLYHYTMHGDGSLASRFQAAGGGRAREIKADPANPVDKRMKERIKESNAGFLRGMGAGADGRIPVRVSATAGVVLLGDINDMVHQHLKGQQDYAKGSVEYRPGSAMRLGHAHGDWIVRGIANPGDRQLVETELRRVSENKNIIFN